MNNKRYRPNLALCLSLAYFALCAWNACICILHALVHQAYLPCSGPSQPHVTVINTQLQTHRHTPLFCLHYTTCTQCTRSGEPPISHPRVIVPPISSTEVSCSHIPLIRQPPPPSMMKLATIKAKYHCHIWLSGTEHSSTGDCFARAATP